MPSEIFNFLKPGEGALLTLGNAAFDFFGRLYTSPELGGLFELCQAAIATVPPAVAILLMLLAVIIPLFPSFMPRPLAVIYSAFLGFAVPIAYFPREAAENLPAIVIALIVGIISLLLHRLVSLLSYFAAVGAFAYLFAYTGYLFGFGEGDIFLSLILSAVIILASLILLAPVKTLGICLFGGLLFTAATWLLIDFSLLFGDAAPLAVILLTVLFALLSLKRMIRKRSAESKHSRQRGRDTES